MLLGKKKVRNFETIVEPLSKVETELAEYIGEQTNKRTELETEKEEIDQKITTSRLEKKKSEHTVVKIAELLGSNLTEADLDDEEPIELKIETIQPDDDPLD